MKASNPINTADRQQLREFLDHLPTDISGFSRRVGLSLRGDSNLSAELRTLAAQGNKQAGILLCSLRRR